MRFCSLRTTSCSVCNSDDGIEQIFQTHQDITYVLHTASPFIQQWQDAAADVLEPAIEGTKQTLRSIHANAPGVKRVVILSSFVTFMVPPAADDKAAMVYDGSTWNPVTWEAAVAQPRLTYTGSKVSGPLTSNSPPSVQPDTNRYGCTRQ